MDLSKIMLILVLLSLGGLIESTKTQSRACDNPERLLSYLDLDHYNRSNPFVDYESVLNPILDTMRGRNSGVPDHIHDLYMCYFQVCRAKDPEEEIAAWRELANEINHRLHTDESVYKITKTIFGDRLVPWIMKPSPSLVMTRASKENECMHQLASIFMQHCGQWNSFGLKYLVSFYAMCSLGVSNEEFADAARETCRDYVYIPSPLLY